jgi:BlaI family transcriptional regulator, penicillinase repressor
MHLIGPECVRLLDVALVRRWPAPGRPVYDRWQNAEGERLIPIMGYVTGYCVTFGNDTWIKQRKMTEDLPDLGDLERRVMQLVWSRGPITSDAVRIALRRRLKDSTIRTVLRRLEQKGYVRHTVDARTYVYAATEPRGKAAARAVLRIVNWFCEGSVDEVLVGMVENAMLDQRQVQMLAEKIAKTKKGQR